MEKNSSKPQDSVTTYTEVELLESGTWVWWCFGWPHRIQHHHAEAIETARLKESCVRVTQGICGGPIFYLENGVMKDEHQDSSNTRQNIYIYICIYIASYIAVDIDGQAIEMINLDQTLYENNTSF